MVSDVNRELLSEACWRGTSRCIVTVEPATFGRWRGKSQVVMV